MPGESSEGLLFGQVIVVSESRGATRRGVDHRGLSLDRYPAISALPSLSLSSVYQIELGVSKIAPLCGLSLARSTGLKRAPVSSWQLNDVLSRTKY
jgi:hypothetical protein